MGFVTAGDIIPVVTDTSWDDFLKYRIFVPLKMNRTTTHNADIVKDNNAAKPYTLFDNKLTVLNYDNVDNIGPCASINSCVNDISHWIIAQLDSGYYDGNLILPYSAMMKTRTSNTIVGDQNNKMFPSKHFKTYGLGWFLEDYEGRKIVSHDGGANGFVTNTTLVPEERFGISILTNTDANWFFLALQEQLLDDLFKVPYRNLSEKYYLQFTSSNKSDDETIKSLWDVAAKNPKPALDLKAYAGKYTNEVYGDIEIKSEGGKLNIYFSHHPQLIGKLLPLGENKFVCNYNPVSWGVKEIPFTVKDGKVQSVIVSVNDFIDYLPYEFKKIN
jgi:sporulation protein YlmC with PRC-barrel domain